MCLKKRTPTEKYKISVDKAWTLSKNWKRAAIIWRVIDHVFAIGSFTASIAVVYISCAYAQVKSAVIILSSFAAVLTLVSFAINPVRYIAKYRTAFQLLNAALVSSIDENGKIIDSQNGFNEIRAAIIKGELYIGKTYDVETIEEMTKEDNSPCLTSSP